MNFFMTEAQAIAALLTAFALFIATLGHLALGIATYRRSGRNGTAIQAVHDCLDEHVERVEARAAEDRREPVE